MNKSVPGVVVHDVKEHHSSQFEDSWKPFATMADRIRTKGKTTTNDTTNKTSSYKTIDDKKTQLSTNNKNIATLNNIIAQKLAGIVDKMVRNKPGRKRHEMWLQRRNVQMILLNKTKDIDYFKPYSISVVYTKKKHQ